MSKDEENLKDTKTQLTDNKQATQHGQEKRGARAPKEAPQGR